MHVTRRALLLSASIALVAMASTACTSGAGSAPMMPMPSMPPMMRPLSDDGVVFVASDDPTHPRLRYVDGQVSQNKSCAIRLENKLNPKIPPVYINGQPIGFCWVPCPDVLVQDVPAAVNRKGLTFQDYFDPARPAVLDAAHCVRLNYEAWFFADDAGRARFLAAPLANCGLLTDPVSKQRFRPHADAPSADFGGVTFYFENEADRSFFVADPERYRLPHWKM